MNASEMQAKGVEIGKVLYNMQKGKRKEKFRIFFICFYLKSLRGKFFRHSGSNTGASP
jgi:hypothetical protein